MWLGISVSAKNGADTDTDTNADSIPFISEDAKFVRSKKITNQFSEQERVQKQAQYVSYLHIGPVFLVLDSHATVWSSSARNKAWYIGRVPFKSRYKIQNLAQYVPLVPM